MADRLDLKYQATRTALADLDTELASGLTASAAPAPRAARMAANRRATPSPNAPTSSPSRLHSSPPPPGMA